MLDIDIMKKLDKEVKFPFGFGLKLYNFQYSDIKLSSLKSFN